MPVVDCRCLSLQSSMRSSTRAQARHQTRQVPLCQQLSLSLSLSRARALSLIQEPSLPSPSPSTHTHTHTHVYRHLLSASWARARQGTGTRGRLRRNKFSKVLPILGSTAHVLGALTFENFCAVADIRDMDLTIYDTQPGQVWGATQATKFSKVLYIGT